MDSTEENEPTAEIRNGDKLVVGVVTEHIAPEEARHLLDALAARGFSVVTITHEMVPDLKSALARVSPPPPPGVLAPLDPALSTASLAHLSGLRAAPEHALRETIAGGRPEAFEAVVDAVTIPRVPKPAWFAQARRNAEARQAFLEDIGALTSDEVADLAGSRATNRRATARRWQAQGRIFEVVHGGRSVYPSFQFDLVTGRPRPEIALVLATLPPTMRGWALALWWTTPLDVLEGARPLDRLDEDAEAVVAAAQADATDWAQAAPIGT